MRDQLRLPISFVAAMATVLLAAPATAEERTVNFYNWSNYMAPDVLENFTKETGIKVVYDTFDANETLETRLLAGKSGYDDDQQKGQEEENPKGDLPRNGRGPAPVSFQHRPSRRFRRRRFSIGGAA